MDWLLRSLVSVSDRLGLRAMMSAMAPLLGALWLCGSPVALRPQTPAPVARDSAGVRVLEYSSDLWRVAPSFRIAGAAIARVGGLREDPSEELNSRHPFLSLLHLTDGVVVATDWSALRYYSPEGRLLRTAGRAGPGPGEFGQLRGACLLSGDSLLAWDYGDQRLSRWSRDGSLLKALERVGYIARDPCFADGSLLVMRVPATARAGTRPRGTVAYARVSQEGETLADLGWFPTESYAPFAPIVSVIAVDSFVVSGSGESFEIWQHSWGGRPVRVVRVVGPAGARLPIPSSGTPPGPASPPVSALGPILPGAAGAFWVRHATRHGDWLCFDSRLRFVGLLRVPPEQGTVVAFREAGVVLRSVDADSAAVLSLHRLSRR